MFDWCTDYCCITTLQEEKVVTINLDTSVQCAYSNYVILNDFFYRKSTEKSIYDIKLAEKNFKRGVKKDTYELSKKMPTATSNIARGGGVRDDVYDPDNNTPATTVSAIQGGEVWEDTYEPLDTLGVGEDSKYVNTATTMAGGGVREDTYYVVPENTVDTAATIALSGGGVRDSMYEDPDNLKTTTSLSYRVKFERRPY